LPDAAVFDDKGGIDIGPLQLGEQFGCAPEGSSGKKGGGGEKVTAGFHEVAKLHGKGGP
jgi:hypothetical protein